MEELDIMYEPRNSAANPRVTVVANKWKVRFVLPVPEWEIDQEPGGQRRYWGVVDSMSFDAVPSALQWEQPTTSEGVKGRAPIRVVLLEEGKHVGPRGVIALPAVQASTVANPKCVTGSTYVTRILTNAK